MDEGLKHFVTEFVKELYLDVAPKQQLKDKAKEDLKDALIKELSLEKNKFSDNIYSAISPRDRAMLANEMKNKAFYSNIKESKQEPGKLNFTGGGLDKVVKNLIGKKGEDNGIVALLKKTKDGLDSIAAARIPPHLPDHSSSVTISQVVNSSVNNLPKSVEKPPENYVRELAELLGSENKDLVSPLKVLNKKYPAIIRSKANAPENIRTLYRAVKGVVEYFEEFPNSYDDKSMADKVNTMMSAFDEVIKENPNILAADVPPPSPLPPATEDLSVEGYVAAISSVNSDNVNRDNVNALIKINHEFQALKDDPKIKGLFSSVESYTQAFNLILNSRQGKTDEEKAAMIGTEDGKKILQDVGTTHKAFLSEVKKVTSADEKQVSTNAADVPPPPPPTLSDNAAAAKIQSAFRKYSASRKRLIEDYKKDLNDIIDKIDEGVFNSVDALQSLLKSTQEEYKKVINTSGSEKDKELYQRVNDFSDIISSSAQEEDIKVEIDLLKKDLGIDGKVLNTDPTLAPPDITDAPPPPPLLSDDAAATKIQAAFRVRSVNKQDNAGMTKLHLAVLGKSNDATIINNIDALIAKGAKIDAPDREGRTALSYAAARGSLAVVEYLIEQGANVNAVDSEGYSPLHDAVGSGNFEVVKKLVDKGADVNAQNNHGNTALHSLNVQNGEGRDILYFLIDEGASLEIKNNDNETPLDVGVDRKGNAMRVALNTPKRITAFHEAVKGGDINVVEKLLNERINVNAQGEGGNTALHLAASSGNLQVVKALTDNGADPAIQNNEGKSPLDVVPTDVYTQNDYNEIRAALQVATVGQAANKVVSQLSGLNKSPSLSEDDLNKILQGVNNLPTDLDSTNDLLVVPSNQENQIVSTPVLSLSQGGKEIGEFFDGLTGNEDYHNNETFVTSADTEESPKRIAAFHEAVKDGDIKGVQKLLGQAIDVNAQGEGGNTALHLAASSGKLKVVKALLDNGADPTIQNNEGKSPLDVAKENLGEKAVTKIQAAFRGHRVRAAQQQGEQVPTPTASLNTPDPTDPGQGLGGTTTQAPASTPALVPNPAPAPTPDPTDPGQGLGATNAATPPLPPAPAPTDYTSIPLNEQPGVTAEPNSQKLGTTTRSDSSLSNDDYSFNGPTSPSDGNNLPPRMIDDNSSNPEQEGLGGAPIQNLLQPPASRRGSGVSKGLSRNQSNILNDDVSDFGGSDNSDSELPFRGKSDARPASPIGVADLHQPGAGDVVNEPSKKRGWFDRYAKVYPENDADNSSKKNTESKYWFNRSKVKNETASYSATQDLASDASKQNTSPMSRWKNALQGRNETKTNYDIIDIADPNSNLSDQENIAQALASNSKKGLLSKLFSRGEKIEPVEDVYGPTGRGSNKTLSGQSKKVSPGRTYLKDWTFNPMHYDTSPTDQDPTPVQPAPTEPTPVQPATSYKPIPTQPAPSYKPVADPTQSPSGAAAPSAYDQEQKKKASRRLGGATGALFGAAIGMIAGPPGMLIGAMIGASIGVAVGHKKPNLPWGSILTGAIVGFAVGGPVGFIVGAMVGAAVSYGVKKMRGSDAEVKAPSTPSIPREDPLGEIKELQKQQEILREQQRALLQEVEVMRKTSPVTNNKSLTPTTSTPRSPKGQSKNSIGG